MLRVAITGASGLVGFHVRVALQAANSRASYLGSESPYEIRTVDRTELDSQELLAAALADVDVVVHLAAVNRPGSGESHSDNIAMAQSLVQALEASHACTQVIFTNSTHSMVADTVYGRAKAEAARLLSEAVASRAGSFVNLVLPHLFGEAGRPHHNNVTSTLCANAVACTSSDIHEGAEVELLHASSVADEICAAIGMPSCTKRLTGQRISVKNLNRQILDYHDVYQDGIFPDVSSSFERDLFNTYRWFLFPGNFPGEIPLHADSRGELIEAVKGGGGGQTFVSWTLPGVIRGDHFHRRKVERFLVLQGEAVIRLRCLFSNEVHEFAVSGKHPSFVDMPTFHTHHIENVGQQPLMTLFWASEIFNPDNPDTCSEPVLCGRSTNT